MKSAMTAAREHSYPPRWMARAKDMEVTDLPLGEKSRDMFRVVVVDDDGIVVMFMLLLLCVLGEDNDWCLWVSLWVVEIP